MSNCRACVPHTPCIPCIEQAKQALCHGYDGPITDFVLISRTTEVVALGGIRPDIVANALHEALLEYGYLKPENPIHQTGS